MVLLAGVALLGACQKAPEPGQPCESQGEATCKDKTTFLECAGGKWEVVSCRGADGCQTQGNVVRCDESLAQDGEACGSREGDHYSCSTDKKGELKCDGGKWKLVAKCSGPKGCEAQGLMVKCDQSVATEGDPCEAGTSGENFACTTDKKSELKCDGGKWKLVAGCKGPKGCEVQGLFVKCDNTMAAVGDPCSKDGDPACSVDGKSIVECRGGKFAVAQACPSACKVDGVFVKCQ
jgi:hypothetical protein